MTGFKRVLSQPQAIMLINCDQAGALSAALRYTPSLKLHPLINLFFTKGEMVGISITYA